jgi:hypothetical protein
MALSFFSPPPEKKLGMSNLFDQAANSGSKYTRQAESCQTSMLSEGISITRFCQTLFPKWMSHLKERCGLFALAWELAGKQASAVLSIVACCPGALSTKVAAN